MSDQDETSDRDEPSATRAAVQPDLAVSSDYKVRGKKEATGGTGVLGHNTATTGESYGVEGVTDSDVSGAAGVRGTATPTTGKSYGVVGIGQTTSSQGVVGAAADSVPLIGFGGSPTGVWGFTDRSGAESGVESGFGVYGQASATSGEAYGVYGTTQSDDGYAVFANGPCKVTGRFSRDTVGASVSLTSEQSVPGSTNTRVEFDTVKFDHGGWDGANHEYVIPEDGLYRFDARISFKTSLPEDTFVQIEIERQGVNQGSTDEKPVSHQEILPSTGGEYNYTAQLTRTVEAVHGSKLWVEIYQTGGSQTLQGVAPRNYLDVTQVG